MTVFMTVIVAYSCGAANYTGGSNEMCLMWSSELTDLQEEYQDGLTIFVRSTPSDIDCQVWPHTTCKVARDSERRCICRKKFHWEEKYIILKVVPSCLAGALEIILLCGIFFIYQSRKGRLTEHQVLFKLSVSKL
ncbi:uncharacterized protein [Spinacia oleracea]|uniref:Uncharacterized protein isoform X2 n=1 Tax=Spinacia oleracea TaxID=3562 RepID=A0ABM3RKK5_SPIOL|nr:uncharacterized protein LOC110796686 isoform X2 [Spinacia oleracea]XP_056696147.1 uncharacterized protein LOC110792819 isoform X2 [Spinacia oleracea]